MEMQKHLSKAKNVAAPMTTMKLLKTMRALNHARIVAEADVVAAVKVITMLTTPTAILQRKHKLIL